VKTTPGPHDIDPPPGSRERDTQGRHPVPTGPVCRLAYRTARPWQTTHLKSRRFLRLIFKLFNYQRYRLTITAGSAVRLRVGVAHGDYPVAFCPGATPAPQASLARSHYAHARAVRDSTTHQCKDNDERKSQNSRRHLRTRVEGLIPRPAHTQTSRPHTPAPRAHDLVSRHRTPTTSTPSFMGKRSASPAASHALHNMQHNSPWLPPSRLWVKGDRNRIHQQQSRVGQAKQPVAVSVSDGVIHSKSLCPALPCILGPGGPL
jgi:hypothetical protein